MIKKMGTRQSRRKFLKKLGAMAGAALVPGLATEEALATLITSDGVVPKKKKAAPKRKKAAPKRKKAAVKRKKVAVKKRIHPYEYQPHTKYDTPHRGVPEPSTVGLVSIGAAAIALASRHKKKGQERKD